MDHIFFASFFLSLVVRGFLPYPLPLSGPTTKKTPFLCASSLRGSYFFFYLWGMHFPFSPHWNWSAVHFSFRPGKTTKTKYNKYFYIFPILEFSKHFLPSLLFLLLFLIFACMNICVYVYIYIYFWNKKSPKGMILIEKINGL